MYLSEEVAEEAITEAIRVYLTGIVEETKWMIENKRI